MRVVYMGTPDFAVETLEETIKAGHEVVLVVTQPDKAKGRGKKLTFTPVKEKALEYHLPVAQPVKVREEAFIEELERLQPEVIVVVAFGQILPERILEIPKYGCINVHASLLPAYRGAAPIQWAVIDGLAETGVTTMYMEKGLDTGDIIEQSRVRLAGDETGGSLFDRLASEGAKLLVKTLKQLEDGTAVRKKQDDSRASYAKMLSKEMGCLDFTKPAEVLERLIRGLNPWPSAYTRLQGKNLKIYQADILSEEETEKLAAGENNAAGTIIAVDKKSFTIRCGSGALKVLNLQLEGKKRMDTSAFLLGFTLRIGMKLGE
ncbi:MAG: methionyl-tRNA formyltransferase [Bacteroidales bacterium]|nr:methionyl-tRNA formyltransferase [Clostridium sp.]MCM1202662.1 methionyl-tRNA formyltransferase [Bacteroidales bacterium]